MAFLSICGAATKKADRVVDDLRDLKVRIPNLEEGQASIHRRLDRVVTRLDRIERRLDLVEPPH